MKNIYEDLLSELKYLIEKCRGYDKIFHLEKEGFFKKIYWIELSSSCFALDQDSIDQNFNEENISRVLKLMSRDKLLELVEYGKFLYFKVDSKKEISIITEDECYQILMRSEDDKLNIYTAYSLLEKLEGFDEDEKLALNKYDEALVNSFQF